MKKEFLLINSERVRFYDPKSSTDSGLSEFILFFYDFPSVAFFSFSESKPKVLFFQSQKVNIRERFDAFI